MDRRVRINGAAFTDVEITNSSNSLQVPLVFKNGNHIDEITISGFEVDASFAVTENLTVYGGRLPQFRDRRAETVRCLSVMTYHRHPIQAVTWVLVGVLLIWRGFRSAYRLSIRRRDPLPHPAKEQTPTFGMPSLPRIQPDFSSQRVTRSTVDAH